MMTPAVWIAPDQHGLTERQQAVYELLIEREVGEFKTLNQCRMILGDESPTAIHATIRVLEAKGLVREADAPWGWRVRWISRPSVYVRQGRRDGWVFKRAGVGDVSMVGS